MLSKIKTVEVFRKDYALTGAAFVNFEVPSDVWPSGNIHRIRLRLKSAAITGFAAAASDYQKVLRSVTWGSQFPRVNVGQAVPGLFLDRVTTVMRRKATNRTTPTANGFDIDYYLPFSWPGSDRRPAFRPKDTALLNINNKALPLLKGQLGPYTDLDTSATACTVTVIVEVDYEPIVRPGFLDTADPMKSGDQPLKSLEFAVFQKSDLATTMISQLISGGGRECIGVFWRELSSADAEVSNIYTAGVATPSKTLFRVGDNDDYTPDVKVEALDARMADEFGIALTAGYHFWMAAAEGRLADAIDLRGGQKFQHIMDNLATIASRKFEYMQINTIDLPENIKALHAAQLGA